MNKEQLMTLKQALASHAVSVQSSCNAIRAQVRSVAEFDAFNQGQNRTMAFLVEVENALETLFHSQVQGTATLAEPATLPDLSDVDLSVLPYLPHDDENAAGDILPDMRRTYVLSGDGLVVEYVRRNVQSDWQVDRVWRMSPLPDEEVVRIADRLPRPE